MILLIISGIFILYKFNHITCKYIYDVFYLIAIPLILGLILIIDLIPTNKVIDILGSITLEMYGIQMIFGFNIASKVFILINNTLLANLITIILIIFLSIIMHYILAFTFKKIYFNNNLERLTNK